MKNNSSTKNNAQKTMIISSLIYLVLGIIMVVSPAVIEAALCYVIGTALTIYGLFNIISFFVGKSQGLYFEMIVGVLAAAIGIFTLISPNTVRGIIFFIIGILIVIDSLMDIKHSLGLKAYEMKYWWVSTILSIIVIVIGICTMIFSSFFADIIVTLLGILLIYEGLSSLVLMILSGHFGKKAASDSVMIDAEARDID
jgi:uncharacterized membrane protein HdeD (DUF308 family)